MATVFPYGENVGKISQLEGVQWRPETELRLSSCKHWLV